jgi:membrane-associated protein
MHPVVGRVYPTRISRLQTAREGGMVPAPRHAEERPPMDLILGLVDFILHIDAHLAEIIKDYGTLTYVILFLIVFCETGLVVTPFLPGDSLLFATGALCVSRATTSGGEAGLNVLLVIPLLLVAAILGDAVNYWIGYRVGPGFLEKGKVRFIKMEHLQRTQRFYEKHGGKTIILARFMPIIRTFAPFVAGIGRMEYRRFAMFNVTGAVCWVVSFTLLGYFFGNLPVVKKNFTYVIFGIIILSVMPMVVEVIKAWREKRAVAST